MKKMKILSWVPIVGAFVAEDTYRDRILTKTSYIFCRIYHFIILFGIGYFLGQFI